MKGQPFNQEMIVVVGQETRTERSLIGDLPIDGRMVPDLICGRNHSVHDRGKANHLRNQHEHHAQEEDHQQPTQAMYSSLHDDDDDDAAILLTTRRLFHPHYYYFCGERDDVAQRRFTLYW